MNYICPKSMCLGVLANQRYEPLEYSTLIGIFAAYRNGELERPMLVEAIHDWQVHDARGRLGYDE
jgi:hypothetical protein